MAQKILLRRGGLANLNSGATVAVSKGEQLFASGTLANTNIENVTFIANADGNGTFQAVGRLFTGTAAANSFDSKLNGLPYYKTDDQALFRLGDSTALDLTGNLEGNTVSAITITTLTGTTANFTGNITGSNLLLTGNANIDGNIVLGGNITIGDANTDNISLGGEFTSDLIPDADNTYAVGSSTRRWNLYGVDSVISGSFSGSFEGDGSGLTQIPASGIVGLNLTQIATTNVTASVSEGTDSFKITSGSETPFKVSNAGVISGKGSGLTELKATESDLVQQILTNQSVGGVSSGTTFNAGTSVEELLRQILITYISPSFSSFTMQDNSSNVSTAVREIGSSFDVDGLVTTVVADNPDGNPPVSGSVVSTGANSNINVNLGDNPYTVGSNTETFTNSTIQRDTNGSVVFTLSGEDKNGSSVTRTQSFSFRTYNVLAATSTDINSNATATTAYTTNNVDSELDTNRSWTATCTADNNNASNYTYIIYPAAYGDLSAITQNGSLPVLTAFTKQTDRTVTLSTGLTVSMRIYKSNATGAFASGTTLTIS